MLDTWSSPTGFETAWIGPAAELKGAALGCYWHQRHSLAQLMHQRPRSSASLLPLQTRPVVLLRLRGADWADISSLVHPYLDWLDLAGRRRTTRCRPPSACSCLSARCWPRSSSWQWPGTTWRTAEKSALRH